MGRQKAAIFTNFQAFRATAQARRAKSRRLPTAWEGNGGDVITSITL